MKQTIKRLLAVLLCFSMIYIPSFTVTASTDLISITEDLTTAASAEGWKVTKQNGNSTAGLVSGEGYKIDQNTETITKTGGGTSTVTVSKVFDNKIVDTENATVTSVKEFKGKYRLYIDFSMKQEAVEGQSDPIYPMLIGGYDASGNFINSLEFQINPTSIRLVGTGRQRVYFPEGGDENHSIDLVVDTISKTYSISIDGGNSVEGELKDVDLDFLNGFIISNMERMADSSYFTFNKVVLEEVESDYNAASEATKTVLANLPAKLAENVNEVTENLTINSVNGVTWASSDENVINSTTGAVTRGTEDKTVIVTATVDLNNNSGVYEKTYTMTVPKLEGSDEGNTGSGGESGGDTPVTGNLISVEEDFTKYTSVDVIPYTTVDTTTASPVTAKVGVGTNGLEIIHTDSQPIGDSAEGENKVHTPVIVHGLEGKFDVDEQNRTALRINRFTGNFKMSFLFNTNVLASYEIETTSGTMKKYSTNYFFEIGQLTDHETFAWNANAMAIFAQINKDKAEIMTSGTSATNALASKNFNYNTEVQFHEMEYVFDTDENTVEVTVDDLKTSKADYNTKGVDLTYIDCIRLQGWHRAQKGTYFNLKNIKIEYLKENPALNVAVEELNKLDASLVDDPRAVTENITLPEADNITWSSSDDDIISIDGLTATVKRWYIDRDVVLTATYEKDGTILMKDYTLTVKEDENLDSVELLDITVTENDSTEDWTEIYEAGNPAGALSVGADGLSVTKVTVAEEDAPVKEYPEYVVERKLYVEEQPYSESTHSASYSAGYSGLYSFGFTLKSNVTGSVPVKVGIGAYEGAIYKRAFDVAVSKDSIHAVYNGEGVERSTRLYLGETKDKTFEFKFIVDTINERIWAYVDGELVADGANFYDEGSFYKFDTLRIVIDKNNTINDYITVNNIKLEELEENVIADKVNLISLINSINVKDITKDSPTAVGSIESLPEKIGGIPVEWVYNSDALNFETGKVVFDAVPVDVLVSAYLTANGVGVRKDFYLTVRAAANEDETLDFITQKLDKAITLQDVNDIRYDIYLPQTFDNMSIDWDSSDTSIIGEDGTIGTVIGSPKSVILTANIEYKGKNYTKPYSFTVSPTSGENTLYSGTVVPETINVNGKNVVVTNTSHTYLTLSQTGCNDGEVNFVDATGKAFLKLFVLNNTYYFDYKGSDYKAYEMPAGKTVDFEIIVIPEKDKFAVWADGERIIDYADFISSVDNFAGITASGTGLTIKKAEVTVDDYGMIDINFDNIDYFSGLNKRVLKENVTLETGVITPATVEWKSSNDSIVNNDGVIVKTPDSYDFTTMTVTLYNTENANVYKSKSIDVAVACDKSKNYIPGAVIKSSSLLLTGFGIEAISDENFDTSFALTSANKNPTITVDFGKELYLNGFYINEDFGLYDSGIKKYTLSYSLDGNNWTDLKSGEITNTASNYIEFGITKMRYLMLTVTESDEKTVYINEIEAYFIASPDEIIKYDIDSVELNLGSVVTENITLPQTGPQGTIFNWTSSNPSVISTTGVVTRPDKGTNVTLTVSASYNGTQYTKTFTTYVTGINDNGGTVIGGSVSGVGGGAGGGVGGGNKTTDSAVPGFVETEPNEPSVTPDATVTFKDVPETHWAYDAINTLKELGIVNGDETGNFNPSSPVTREQFVKMLVEASDIELSDKNSEFKDVDSAMWYAPYIQTGVEAGLINGFSPTEFGVGSDIKRCDMAVMLYRIIMNPEEDVMINGTFFADDEIIPIYAKLAVYAVRDAGIIEGYNNMFNPNESLTRAEAATVLMKFLELKQ